MRSPNFETVLYQDDEFWGEVEALASLIEVQRKAIETVEIEQRLAAVEQSVDPR